MAKRSRDKGKRGEREAAAFLREHGFQATRGVQYQGGPDSGDLQHDVEGCHIEVKRVEALRLYEALEQAKADADPSDYPIVLHRKNGKPWVVIMYAADFLHQLPE